MHDMRRRTNAAMAQRVQCGVTLVHIAGIVEALRYLRAERISESVIERVLSNDPRLLRPNDRQAFSDVANG
ncbi:MAG TPA: hypothetical protein VGF27_14020 [Pseudoduganella sp.]